MTKSRKTIAALAALALVSVIIIVIHLRPPAPEPAAAPGPKPANFLWEATSPGGRTLYLLGSIHLAYPGLYPLNEEIEAAFARSSALVVEINTEEMPDGLLDEYIRANGFAPDAPPLPERLSPATWTALEKSGFYNPALSALKPWLAGLVIQLQALEKNGFHARYGLDLHFIEAAWDRDLEILELETIDDQMGVLINMSPAEADLFLRAAVLEMDDLPELMNAFLDTWRRGDTAGFAAAFFREYDRYPELTPLMDKIIFHRNERMAEKIDQMRQDRDDDHLFVVIGAGHLVSDRSVLTDLEGRGYSIRQL